MDELIRKFDVSLLPSECSTEIREGLFAELDSRGSVCSLAGYRDGEVVTERLELDASRLSATSIVLKQFQLSDTSDSEDAWEQYCNWVALKISEIQDQLDFVRRCGFCSKTNAEVRQLIAGPQSYICDECVALCNDILREAQDI